VPPTNTALGAGTFARHGAVAARQGAVRQGAVAARQGAVAARQGTVATRRGAVAARQDAVCQSVDAATWLRSPSKNVCCRKLGVDFACHLLTVTRDWNPFLAFNIVDGYGEGGGREPLRWLLPLRLLC
jgi:hypothetical protein